MRKRSSKDRAASQIREWHDLRVTGNWAGRVAVFAALLGGFTLTVGMFTPVAAPLFLAAASAILVSALYVFFVSFTHYRREGASRLHAGRRGIWKLLSWLFWMLP